MKSSSAGPCYLIHMVGGSGVETEPLENSQFCNPHAYFKLYHVAKSVCHLIEFKTLVYSNQISFVF